MKTETETATLIATPIARRKFLKLFTGGIAVTFVLGSHPLLGSDGTIPEDQLNAWLQIGEKGDVTIFTGKAEVGQNIRTSLAQLVAEELGVDIHSITMVMGDTDLTPYDRGTFGSRSTPYMGPQLRQAAATAREILIDMAADSMAAKREELFVENGKVISKSSKKSIGFGELTKGQALVKKVNVSVGLKPAAQWKVAGTSVHKVNGASFINGQHRYTSDLTLPGMLYGKIVRPPVYGAKLKSADVSAAKAMNGVEVVQDGDFLGVVAPDFDSVLQAAKAVKAEWTTPELPSRSEIFDWLRQHGSKANDNGTSGDAASVFSTAPVKVKTTFHVDYIAHAPLEPRAGLAEWKNGKLTVWTGTQRPFGVQEDLAKQFNIPKEKIRVIQPDTGSGYGGKHTGEAGVEAARLAKAVSKPVKVLWSREEEFVWAYFRPAGVIDVMASVSKDGMVTSWEFHNYNSGPSGIETPYVVKDKKISFHPVESPLRQGSYRGLAATANTFARESVMYDLAAELKIDQLDFRLKNLGEPRMKAVLVAAAEKFGWKNKEVPSGHGIGIACGEEKGSYVATCAEIAIEDGDVKVVHAVTAFECGTVINPWHLENQVFGSVIQGLGGALFERVDFKEGKILNPQFSKYRVPRFSDTPKVDTVVINRKDLPAAGAGETPILAIAPAVRNAIANATGKKLYSLPLVPDGLSD
jgi:isoquinoline 1-oxidoreductase